MTPDTALDLLTQARDWFTEHPETRCTGVYARDRRDNPIHWSSPKAARWSLDGKLLQWGEAERISGVIVVRAGLNHIHAAALTALDATRPIPTGTIETNNDDLDTTAVLAWLDAAIAWLEGADGA